MNKTPESKNNILIDNNNKNDIPVYRIRYISEYFIAKYKEEYGNASFVLVECNKDGDYHGVHLKYDRHTQSTKVLGHYIDGRIWTEFSPHSTTTIKEQFSYKNGILHGNFRTFYESGTPRSAGIYEDGKLTDTYVEFAPNGYITLYEEYENGKLNGERIQYCPNTEDFVRVEHYKSNKLHGTVELYSKGTIKEQKNYADGKKHGPQLFFDINTQDLIRKEYNVLDNPVTPEFWETVKDLTLENCKAALENQFYPKRSDKALSALGY